MGLATIQPGLQDPFPRNGRGQGRLITLHQRSHFRRFKHKKARRCYTSLVASRAVVHIPAAEGGYKIYQLNRGDPLAIPPPHRLQAAWADLSSEARAQIAQLLNIQYPQSNTIQALLLRPQGLTHRPTNLDIRFQTPNCLVPSTV